MAPPYAPAVRALALFGALEALAGLIKVSARGEPLAGLGQLAFGCAFLWLAYRSRGARA